MKSYKQSNIQSVITNVAAAITVVVDTPLVDSTAAAFTDGTTNYAVDVILVGYVLCKNIY